MLWQGVILSPCCPRCFLGRQDKLAPLADPWDPRKLDSDPRGSLQPICSSTGSCRRRGNSWRCSAYTHAGPACPCPTDGPSQAPRETWSSLVPFWPRTRSCRCCAILVAAAYKSRTTRALGFPTPPPPAAYHLTTHMRPRQRKEEEGEEKGRRWSRGDRRSTAGAPSTPEAAAEAVGLQHCAAAPHKTTPSREEKRRNEALPEPLRHCWSRRARTPPTLPGASSPRRAAGDEELRPDRLHR